MRAQWGLLEWVNDSCDRFKVNLLLIEAAGPGLSADGGVRQELAAGIIQSARDFPIGKIRQDGAG